MGGNERNKPLWRHRTRRYNIKTNLKKRQYEEEWIDPARNTNKSRDFMQAIITIEAVKIVICLLLGGQGSVRYCSSATCLKI